MYFGDNIKNLKNSLGSKTMTYELDGKKYKTQKEYRKALFNHTKYSNAYREWTDDLDTELVNLAKGMTIEELALHFKRKPSAIRIRLNKIDK